ncbi:MAG: universal stress protein, partial [bacterium]
PEGDRSMEMSSLACCEQSNEYKTILAPVDMGLNSRAAVDRVSRFFPLAEIELLYVFQRHSDGMIDNPAAQSDCIPEVQKASGSDLKGQLSIFAQSLHRPDVISRRIVIEGDAKEVVFSQARKIDADLIVLGYKPRGSVAKLLSSSLVSQIVKEANYDVFLGTVR